MLMGQGPGEETDTNQTAKQNQKSIKQTHMTIRQIRHQNPVRAENTQTNPSPPGQQHPYIAALIHKCPRGRSSAIWTVKPGSVASTACRFSEAGSSLWSNNPKLEAKSWTAEEHFHVCLQHSDKVHTSGH